MNFKLLLIFDVMFRSPAHSKSRSRSGSIDKKRSQSRSQSISNKRIK